MKRTLGNRHLMAESPEAVAMQNYRALIAAADVAAHHWQTPDQVSHGVDPFLHDWAGRPGEDR